MTRVKYRLLQISYYTAINEYSDATPDEGRRMLSGDQSDEDLDQEPPMEDAEAERLLLRALDDDSAAEGSDRGGSQGVGRRKRSPEEGAAGPAGDGLKIRWRLPSNNPDYEPIRVGGQGRGPGAARVAHDIPDERAAEIDIGAEQVKRRLMEMANGGLGRVKSMIGGAMDWIAQGGQPAGEQVGAGPDTEPVGGAADERQSPVETRVVVDWRRSGCVGPVRNQGDCMR